MTIMAVFFFLVFPGVELVAAVLRARRNRRKNLKVQREAESILNAHPVVREIVELYNDGDTSFEDRVKLVAAYDHYKNDVESSAVNSNSERVAAIVDRVEGNLPRPVSGGVSTVQDVVRH